MQTLIKIILVYFAALCLQNTSAGFELLSTPKMTVTLMMKPKQGVGMALRLQQIDVFHRQLNARKVFESSRMKHLQFVQFEAIASEKISLIEQYRQSGLFEYVEEDSKASMSGTPVSRIPYEGNYLPSYTNTPYTCELQLWSRTNTGVPSILYNMFGNEESRELALAGADVRTERTWELIRSDAPNIVVAVIDSGMDINNPYLKRNVWVNTYGDYTNGVHDINGIFIWMPRGAPGPILSADVSDRNVSHGTMVAGIIGAYDETDNEMRGVVRWIQIMAIGTYYQASEIIIAFEYAITHGAKIINCSWVFGEESLALKDAFIAAGEAGVMCICTVDNQPTNYDTVPIYPAWWRLDNMIVVTSTTALDTLFPFVGYGLIVDLGVPGRRKISTFDTRYGIKKAFGTGNSYGTPEVTGALALLMAEYPNETLTELKERLLNSVDVLPSLTGKVKTGGRLNIYKALTYQRKKMLSIALTNGEMVLTAHTLDGNYRIEESGDMIVWSTFTNLVSANTVLSVPNWTNNTQMFFRVVKQ